MDIIEHILEVNIGECTISFFRLINHISLDLVMYPTIHTVLFFFTHTYFLLK